jgi:GAF domain-containing protein
MSGLQVVLGASGGIGGAVVRELASRAVEVRAVSRRGEVEALDGVSGRAADVATPAGAAAACEGASVVYHCVQPPYHRWAEELPPLTRVVTEAVARAGAKLVVADNLYMYGPITGPISEASPEQPTSRKGRVRKEVAEALLAAHTAGRVRVTIGRASDYYGPRGRNSVAGETLFGAAVSGKPVGVVIAATARPEPLARGIETRINAFTELVATAIANAQAREELSALADEQAALRRVATLVARAAPPAAVFASVAEEVGRLLPADETLIGRFEPGGSVTSVAGWNKTGDPVPIGSTAEVGGRNVTALVFESGRPARIDSYADASGAAAEDARQRGLHAAVGAPISVEDRLWGVMIVGSTSDAPLPADTEARLANFAELVATAIANAEARAELTASRARIVAAADETRRRIERDLHDGAQQRLVSLTLQLRAAQASVPPELEELKRSWIVSPPDSGTRWTSCASTRAVSIRRSWRRVVSARR